MTLVSLLVHIHVEENAKILICTLQYSASRQSSVQPISASRGDGITDHCLESKLKVCGLIGFPSFLWFVSVKISGENGGKLK